MSHIINLNSQPNPELTPPILNPSAVSTKKPYQSLKITVSPFKDMASGELLNLYIGGYEIDKTIQSSDIGHPVDFVIDDQESLSEIFSDISGDSITVQYVLSSRDSNNNLSMPSTLKIDNTAPVVTPPDQPAHEVSKFYLQAIRDTGVSNNGTPCVVRAHLVAKPNTGYIAHFSYYGVQSLTGSLATVTQAGVVNGELGLHEMDTVISVDQSGLGQVDMWYHSLGDKPGFLYAQAELFTTERKHIIYTDDNLNPKLNFN